MYDLSIFEKALKELHIELNQTQKDQFLKYYELLIQWNSFMNLTTITDFNEVLEKHFLDSLSIIKICNLSEERIIDIGTGAGFPGIPIKIVFPKTSMILADSLMKRINFLNQVIEELQLKNIGTIHGRAEDLAKKMEHRESYDICVSRAVANLSTLSEYCLPFVKIGGLFVSYKAESANQELEQAKRAIELCGGRFEKSERFNLPYTDYQRCLISVRKYMETDNRYPRKAGLPSKEPLS